jgi:adenine-specific DNA methylase
VNRAVIEAFEKDLPGERFLVVDPFSGGGVIPLTAVQMGHRTYAQDLNPWAAHGLTAALCLPEAHVFDDALKHMEAQVGPVVTKAYATSMADGEEASIAHTFRVSSSVCVSCQSSVRHFPHSMVSLLVRKERGQPECLLACPAGHIFAGAHDRPWDCPECSRRIDGDVTYTRSRFIECWNCGTTASLDAASTTSSWKWEVALVERVAGSRRELAVPRVEEVAQADSGWEPTFDLGKIPDGSETDVLLRHGFQEWSDLYPARQRYVTEQLLKSVDSIEDSQTREALRWAVLGTTEMAGLASRWDRWYLKSYETMAGHRFNFTTFAVEPNVWGTTASGRGTLLRRGAQMRKAADWLHSLGHPLAKVIEPEDEGTADYDARVVCGSSEVLDISDRSIRLCLTDPPYHDDVQYGELSLPLRAWAGLNTDELVGEAVVNGRTGQNSGAGEYRKLLAAIFGEVQKKLRTDGHLVFSYANRAPEAWVDLLEALNDAGLRCAGYLMVHSENETDHAKRDVRACTLDLLLDLVPASGEPLTRWRPHVAIPSAEEEFLLVVGTYLWKLGSLKKGWQEKFVTELRLTRFLAKR